MQSSDVKDTRTLILRVTAPDATLAMKHRAFGEMIVHFQDMAFGCAYAMLGDSYLAEEAAQEAFIAAWQKLDQLRQPEAFPAWLKRIVFTQCHRLTRGKRLEFLPLESAADFPASDPDPMAGVEKLELQENVLKAIGELPEHERIVITLFYVNDYSQNEIGGFLEVPVTTVARRLHTARRRLKQRMIDMLKDDLEQHRPSRNESFVEQVSARLRPFVEQDWGHLSALAYDLEPDYRADDEAWLSARRQFDEARYLRRHYVAEHAGTKQILGYGVIEQSIFHPNYRLFLLANAKWLRAGVGDLLFDRLMKDLREANAITVWARSYVSQTALLAFLAARGFVETSRVWDLRLTVSEAEHSDFLPAIEQVAARGLVITTLADERQRDPDRLRKLHAFLNLVKADDPQRQPFSPIPFDAVVRWFEKSYVLPDACFIAKHGADYIGFADLILFEALPGGAKSGFTGVKREYRRQGVATALKLRAIEYARAHGYQTIRAFTPTANRAMLALNEKLGFQRRFGYVTMEKFLRNVATIDSNVYDEYVGQYAPASDVVAKFGFDPGFAVTITKEGQRLFAVAKEQKNELFPESETEFFIKEFYGHLKFVRDEKGKVSHLIFRDSEHEARAQKIK